MHGSLIVHVVKILDEVNWAAAFSNGVIIPFIPVDRNGVVGFHPHLQARADELFTLAAKELHKVYAVGRSFLFVREWDIGHSYPPSKWAGWYLPIYIFCS